MNDFLPTNYEVPESEGNYFKLKKGENRFRVLGSAIVGFEYWDKNNKPVRSKLAFEEVPEDAKLNAQGQFQPKHFWAFLVWNYGAKKIQVLELTQKSIMNAVKSYVSNPKWGSPMGYDIVATREGEGLETEYTVIAEPHSEAPLLNVPDVDLTALFSGADPFAAK